MRRYKPGPSNASPILHGWMDARMIMQNHPGNELFSIGHASARLVSLSGFALCVETYVVGKGDG